MSRRDVITEKLTRAFAPTRLEIIDESNRHRGHAGWRQEGETHFRVRIATPQFAGMSRLAQHRAVMATLAEELASGVHALAIEVTDTAQPAPPEPHVPDA